MRWILDLNKKSGNARAWQDHAICEIFERNYIHGRTKANFAYKLYAYRSKNTWVVLLQTSNGLDAIVFTAGVGGEWLFTRKLVLLRYGLFLESAWMSQKTKSPRKRESGTFKKSIMAKVKILLSQQWGVGNRKAVFWIAGLKSVGKWNKGSTWSVRKHALIQNLITKPDLSDCENRDHSFTEISPSTIRMSRHWYSCLAFRIKAFFSVFDSFWHQQKSARIFSRSLVILHPYLS